MDDIKFHKDKPNTGAHHPRFYSPNYQPLLQSLLATLADLDFDYEKEREKLSKLSPDTNIKIRALEKLKTRHHERREPYIRQLAIIQKQLMDLRA
jgi:hypothetical protein